MEILLPSGRGIGDKHRPFVIAEIGSNWTKLEHITELIGMAKSIGADAVKLQYFTAQDLYGMDLPFKFDQELSLDWLSIASQKAKAFGIEFMCSAFSPEGIDAVDPFVSIHKVASGEMTHLRMLQKLRSIGKPVVLSTGASGLLDIQMANNVLTSSDEKEGGTTIFPPCSVVVMHCVSAYPARVVNFERLKILKGKYPCVGFSDHSLDVIEIPRKAVSLGACVIEKHIKNITDHTPDSGHSLKVEEFKQMILGLNNPDFQPYSDEEKEMLLKHNRRLIATKKIDIGEKFDEGINFGIYRSLKEEAHACHPFLADTVQGTLATRDIKAGEGIGPGDFK